MEKLLNLYRPIKKAVTMRVDADVLAWFKRDGRRYQTRINRALRELMVREIKEREAKEQQTKERKRKGSA
jgi:hypothetical protein